MAVDRSRRRRLQAVPEPNVGKGLKGAERGSGEDGIWRCEDHIRRDKKEIKRYDNDALLLCY